MEKGEYRRWFENCPDSRYRYRRLMHTTIDTYIANVARVEKHAGPIEILYLKDRFAGFLSDPPGIPTTAAGLVGYKTAVRHYREFLDYRMRQRLGAP